MSPNYKWPIIGMAALTLALSACDPPTDTTLNTESETSDTSASKPKTTKPKAVTTVAQRSAMRSAKQYIGMPGFSRAGLLKQLTSSYGDGFKKADATYAINHIKVDWNKEAVESAKQYLDMSGFSRSALIKQLTSSYGDGYTRKQAEYAVKAVGL